jgi:hypothetical protein
VKNEILRLAVHVAQRREEVSWLLTYYWVLHQRGIYTKVMAPFQVLGRKFLNLF